MVELNTQKRIAGNLFKASKRRVVFDPERLTDIKEAITKRDIKSLIKEGAISKKPIKSISRVRARKIHKQKVKGRRKGEGRRKGTANARSSSKKAWINRIRMQRDFLKVLKSKEIITTKMYRELYKKAKGGFFRSKNYLKMYIKEKLNKR